MASVVERFLDPLIISPTKDLGMGTAVEQSLHRDGFSVLISASNLSASTTQIDRKETHMKNILRACLRSLTYDTAASDIGADARTTDASLPNACGQAPLNA